MSFFDYQLSRLIDYHELSFEATLMACMRAADTDNARLLRTAFPDVWQELQARYDAPGGLLPTDPAVCG